jgi:Lon protease-like protein
LALVPFPGVPLHLHIFEPRYKQLIKDCINQKKTFGIPCVINDKVMEFGTMMEITEVSKEYEDGKMDIKTKGVRVFRMLEIVKEIPEKLYSGGIVSYLYDHQNGSQKMMTMLIAEMRKLHTELGIHKEMPKRDDELSSFDIAPHVGLSMEDEYQLLQYENELHRQEFIKRHLAKVMPIVDEMQSLKKKVQLNGHFKNMDGFNF